MMLLISFLIQKTQRVWRDARRLLLEEYKEILDFLISTNGLDVGDKVEISIFQSMVLDLLNEELESYRLLHNARPHRLMGSLSPDQVWEADWSKRRMSGLRPEVVMFHANRIVKDKAPYPTHPDDYYDMANLAANERNLVQQLTLQYGKPTTKSEIVGKCQQVIQAYRIIKNS